MTDKIIVWTTCASEEEARRVARHLVEQRLAACATITPGLQSIYHWRGAVEDSAEWGLTMKTRLDLFSELEQALREVHSYEVPELVAVPVAAGSEAYLAWLDAELRPPAV